MANESNFRVYTIFETDPDTGKPTDKVAGYILADGMRRIELSLENAQQVLKTLTGLAYHDNGRVPPMTSVESRGPLSINTNTVSSNIPRNTPPGFVEVERYKSKKNQYGHDVYYALMKREETKEFGWYAIRDNKIDRFEKVGIIEDPTSRIGRFLMRIEGYENFSAFKIFTETRAGWQRIAIMLRILEKEEYLKQVSSDRKGTHYSFTQKGRNLIPLVW